MVQKWISGTDIERTAWRDFDAYAQHRSEDIFTICFELDGRVSPLFRTDWTPASRAWAWRDQLGGFRLENAWKATTQNGRYTFITVSLNRGAKRWQIYDFAFFLLSEAQEGRFVMGNGRVWGVFFEDPRFSCYDMLLAMDLPPATNYHHFLNPRNWPVLGVIGEKRLAAFRSVYDTPFFGKKM